MDANVQENWSDKKILVAEDIYDNYLLIQNMLMKTNADIIWAKGGNECIEIVKDNDDIDLILMDIRMPDLNGYETTRQIKSFRKKIPIIAQTAYAIDGDETKALNAGCDDYISKPIRKALLIKKIKRFF